MRLGKWPVYSTCSGNLYNRHPMSELLLVGSLATTCHHMSQILLVNAKNICIIIGRLTSHYISQILLDNTKKRLTVMRALAQWTFHLHFFCTKYLSHFNSDFHAVKSKVFLFDQQNHTSYKEKTEMF